MKLRHSVSMALVASSMVVAGIALAAQDKWALKAPNGISFAEFKGYESWQMIGSSDPDDESGAGRRRSRAASSRSSAIPCWSRRTARAFPTTANRCRMALHSPRSNGQKARETVPYAVTLTGKLAEVSFMLKDSKRFPKTNGWGYATFQYDAASDTWKAKGDNADFVNACHGCHTIVKARDFVFTHYAKR